MFRLENFKSLFINHSLYIIIFLTVFFRNSVINYYIFTLDYNLNISQKFSLIFINTLNDFFILFFFLFLFNLIFEIKTRKSSRIYLFFLCLMIITYLIDMGSIIFFGIRFHMLKYFRNIILFNNGLLILFFFFIVLYLFLFKAVHKTKSSLKTINLFYVIFFTGLLLIFLNSEIKKVSKKFNIDIHFLTDNFLTVNSSLNFFIPYLNYRELYKKYDSYFVSEKGLNKKINIILIISESLSAMNSYRTSRIYNYLPQVDNITKDGKLFTNMVSGGYGTRLALHSILEGDFTAGGVLGGDYFKEKYNIPLGSFFNNMGYNTYFFAGCPLSFNHDSKFIKKCGFKYIYDSSDKFYKKYKRYTFNSPPDEALYKFALKKINKLLKENKLFFITMLTISGHTPYYSPYGYGEEKVFHYIDDSFARFYNELKRINFFKNGILIVCGDHRQFGIVKKKELKVYKNKYSGRVVCFIIGKNIKRNIVDENYYNQNDIYYSLIKHFGNKKVKIFKYYNDIFTGRIRRNFAFTYPASEQSVIYIYKKNGFGIIKLKGKWSDFIELRNITEKEKKEILEFINVFRNYQLSKAYHLI